MFLLTSGYFFLKNAKNGQKFSQKCQCLVTLLPPNRPVFLVQPRGNLVVAVFSFDEAPILAIFEQIICIFWHFLKQSVIKSD